VAKPSHRVASNAIPPSYSPVTAPGSPLVIRIGIFDNLQDSNTLVNALAEHGYSVHATRNPVDSRVHVEMGPFASRDEATEARDHLIRDGYNAVLQP
jgi:cell division septation protein DedD